MGYVDKALENARFNVEAEKLRNEFLDKIVVLVARKTAILERSRLSIVIDYKGHQTMEYDLCQNDKEEMESIDILIEDARDETIGKLYK